MASFSLTSIFHSVALKALAIEVLAAAKVIVDAEAASQPAAAPLQPFADSTIDAIVARLQHLEITQEQKALDAAAVAPQSIPVAAPVA